MQYEMEQLIPIVARLSEKYTSKESTSISYEKAEQLMGAVIYCIEELEKEKEAAIVTNTQMPAEEAYELGLKCVIEKVKKTMALYHEIIAGFEWYENRCLYDTVAKGMPEFFKWYDVYFNPQEELLLLDYPVEKDLTKLQGVDKIYEYLLCIKAEQDFLQNYAKTEVVQILREYSAGYKSMIENIGQIVRNVL